MTQTAYVLSDDGEIIVLIRQKESKPLYKNYEVKLPEAMTFNVKEKYGKKIIHPPAA